jgi:hypothetical protein
VSGESLAKSKSQEALLLERQVLQAVSTSLRLQESAEDHKPTSRHHYNSTMIMGDDLRDCVSQGGLERRQPLSKPVAASLQKAPFTKGVSLACDPASCHPVQPRANASVSKRFAEGRTTQDQLTRHKSK